MSRINFKNTIERQRKAKEEEELKKRRGKGKKLRELHKQASTFIVRGNENFDEYKKLLELLLSTLGG